MNLQIKNIESDLSQCNDLIARLTNIERIFNDSNDIKIIHNVKNILYEKINNLSYEYNNLIEKCDHDFYKEITPYNDIYICSKCGIIKHD